MTVLVISGRGELTTGLEALMLSPYESAEFIDALRKDCIVCSTFQILERSS